jgi:glycosyltransferase involved in cell wall biosynthesis
MYHSPPDEGGLRTQGYFKRSLPDKSLITIITVVYNGLAHIEETIQSVIGQTYGNIEYIIIDGGSTDGTLEIIRRYEHAIDYWVSEKDNGIYGAMNKGVNLAIGDWVNFMNADDFFFNHQVIEKIVSQIEKEKEKEKEKEFIVFYGKLHFIELNKEIIFILGKHWNIAKNELKYRMSIAHQSAFTNRKAILKAGGFNESYEIAGDYELTLRLLRNSDAFFIENIVIACMRTGGISSNRKNYLKVIREIKIAQKENGYDHPRIYWILVIIKHYIKHVLSFFFGEELIRKLWNILNNLLCKLA